jgi:hypothetical protein
MSDETAPEFPDTSSFYSKTLASDLNKIAEATDAQATEDTEGTSD